MSNDGTRPVELSVTLVILVPASFDSHTYRHEFRAGLPLKQRKHYLQGWIADLSIEGMEHYFRRVHHSQKVKLDNLERITESLHQVT